MGKTSNLVFIILAVILVFVAIATIGAALGGNVWYSSEISGEIGLFKYCVDAVLTTEKICTDREEILSFKDERAWKFQLDVKNIDLDIIIMLGAVSALFIIPPIIILIWALLISKSSLKKTLVLSAGILMIIAACAAVGCVGYAEYLKSERLKNTTFDRGWTMILAWVSAGVGVIAAIIILLGNCFISDETSSKYDDRNIPIDVRNQVNRGYEYNDHANQGFEHNNETANQNRTVDIEDRFSANLHRPPSYNSESVQQSKRSSRSEFKPEMAHDKPLQTKFVYEDNKRNNRYKYTYNPEYMEQQYREESPQLGRGQSPEPPSTHRNSSHQEYGYQPNYNHGRVRPSYNNPGYEIR